MKEKKTGSPDDSVEGPEMEEALKCKRRRAAESRIGRLNQVLWAIRNVNRLVLHEKDPVRLARLACEEMVSTGGFQTSWIFMNSGALCGEQVFESGWGEAFRPLDEKLRCGEVPPCCSLSVERHGPVTIQLPSPACGGCPLADIVGDGDYRPRTALARALVSDGRLFGFICVTASTALAFGDEEESLLSEAADNIAFALAALEKDEERCRLIDALRESETGFRKLTDGIPDLFFVMDRDPRCLYWNAACENLTGISADEAIGKTLLELFPAAGRSIEEILVEVMKRRKPVPGEMKYYPAGSEIVFDAVAYPFFEHVAVLARDITEKKKLQAGLAQSDRLASMGLLAAGVAHEINNPLAYILYNLESLTDDIPCLAEKMRRSRDALEGCLGSRELNELLGDDADALTPLLFEEVKGRFADALDGTRRIRNIVRGLGSFSRVEKDHLAPVSIHYTIECAISMAYNEIRYRARLVKDFSSVPRILASEGRLSQVFLNLLINAAHSIEEGYVERNEIRVRTWEEGGEVRVEVRDTGKGIAGEDLDRIFEPFFSTKGVGSGLGLFISQRIVAGYGGRVEVKSEVGKGTSFFISLPIMRHEEAGVTEGEKEVVEESMVRGRVLVIDDEPGIRRAVKRMLREHEVVDLGSGEEGKALLDKDQRFDLILCDMMMAGVSGMELHEWLSSRNAGLAKRIVFITGGAFTPRSHGYLSKVGNIHVEKPFDVDNFRKMVSELIVAFRTRG